MIKTDLDYWEQEKEYNENIISVFEVENILTKHLQNIENKSNKEIIDFGCGIGNALPHIKDFKKVYAVDFSQNMLNQAKKNYQKKNIDFIEGNLINTIIKPVDVILAVSSIMPKNSNDFDLIIQNLLKNIKEKGEILIVLPSFESRTMLFHYQYDFMLKNGNNRQDIINTIMNATANSNYSPFGYIITDIKLIQKHWLKEEIFFRLEKYNLKHVEISKLELDWEKQIINLKQYKEYPKLWFWFVKIKT